MKNHRFPWLRNRTTDNRKCEKARNIKEKRTIEMFSTVSKQLVVRLSSPSADFISLTPENFGFPGFFLSIFGMSSKICTPGEPLLSGSQIFFKKFVFLVRVFSKICPLYQ